MARSRRGVRLGPAWAAAGLLGVGPLGAISKFRRRFARARPGRRMELVEQFVRRLRKWRRAGKRPWVQVALTALLEELHREFRWGRLGVGAVARAAANILPELEYALASRSPGAHGVAQAACALGIAAHMHGDPRTAASLIEPPYAAGYAHEQALQTLAEAKVADDKLDDNGLHICMAHLLSPHKGQVSARVETAVRRALHIGPEHEPDDVDRRCQANRRLAEGADTPWAWRHLGWAHWHRREIKRALECFQRAVKSPASTHLDRMALAAVLYWIGRPRRAAAVLSQALESPSCRLFRCLCAAEAAAIGPLTRERAAALAGELLEAWQAEQVVVEEEAQATLHAACRPPYSAAERVLGLAYRLGLYGRLSADELPAIRPQPGPSHILGAWREAWVLEGMAHGDVGEALKAFRDARGVWRKFSRRAGEARAPSPALSPVAALLALCLQAAGKEDLVDRYLPGVVGIRSNKRVPEWDLAWAHVMALRGDGHSSLQALERARQAEDELPRRAPRSGRRAIDRRLYAARAYASTPDAAHRRRAWAEVVLSYIELLECSDRGAVHRAFNHLAAAEEYLDRCQHWAEQAWVDFLRACIDQRRDALAVHVGLAPADRVEGRPWPLDALVEAAAAAAARGKEPVAVADDPRWHMMPQAYLYWFGQRPSHFGTQVTRDRYWQASQRARQGKFSEGLALWPSHPGARWQWAEGIVARAADGGRVSGDDLEKAKAILRACSTTKRGWRALVGLGILAWVSADPVGAAAAWLDALDRPEMSHHCDLSRMLAAGILQAWSFAHGLGHAVRCMDEQLTSAREHDRRSPWSLLPPAYRALVHVQAALVLDEEPDRQWQADWQLQRAIDLAPECLVPWLAQLLRTLAQRKDAAAWGLARSLARRLPDDPCVEFVASAAALLVSASSPSRLLDAAQRLCRAELGARIRGLRPCLGNHVRWWWVADPDCPWIDICWPWSRFAIRLSTLACEICNTSGLPAHRTIVEQVTKVFAQPAVGVTRRPEALSWLYAPPRPQTGLPDELVQAWTAITRTPPIEKYWPI